MASRALPTLAFAFRHKGCGVPGKEEYKLQCDAGRKEGIFMLKYTVLRNRIDI